MDENREGIEMIWANVGKVAKQARIEPVNDLKRKIQVTMDSLHSDGSVHEACEKCGFCKACGDCNAFGCRAAHNNN